MFAERAPSASEAVPYFLQCHRQASIRLSS